MIYKKQISSSNRDLFKGRDRRLETDNPYVGSFTKYVSIISFSPVLAFGIIGFLLSLQRGREVFLLLSPILSFWFGYSLFFTQIRYRIPIEPFLIILASFGLTASAEWVLDYVNSSLFPKTYKRDPAF